MTDTLFPELEPTPGFVKAEPKAPEPKLSADRRRTKRQKDSIAAGIHPVTRLALTDVDGATCGTCALRQHFGKYAKCTYLAPPDAPHLGPYVSSSATTDLRAWWPGCARWQTKSAGGAE